MPHSPAYCWADSDTSGSKPLTVTLYYTTPVATDLDQILTILGRILTGTVRIGPPVVAYGSRELSDGLPFYKHIWLRDERK